jgi:hypothetical protein
LRDHGQVGSLMNGRPSSVESVAYIIVVGRAYVCAVTCGRLSNSLHSRPRKLDADGSSAPYQPCLIRAAPDRGAVYESTLLIPATLTTPRLPFISLRYTSVSASLNRRVLPTHASSQRGNCRSVYIELYTCDLAVLNRFIGRYKRPLNLTK